MIKDLKVSINQRYALFPNKGLELTTRGGRNGPESMFREFQLTLGPFNRYLRFAWKTK